MSALALTEALALALERVEAGETVAAVLADFPEHAEAMGPLLQAAMFVRQRRPQPSAAFRAAVQHQLTLEPQQGRPVRLGRGRVGWTGWLLRAAAAAAAVVLSFSGLAVASADSRPGDLLYPVRRGVQRVQDVAEKVAPPIGRAIDYLTIRELPDAGVPAKPEPTVALAPGSSVLDAGDRAERTGGVAPAVATARERRMPEPAARQIGASATGGGETAVAGGAAPGFVPPATRVPQPSEAAPTPAPSPSPARSPSPPAPEAASRPAPGGVSGQVTANERGREHDREDRGVGGALVSIYPLGADGVPLWSQGAHVRTRDDGTFAFAELPPGSYKLAVGEIAPWVWRRWYRDTANVFAAVPIVVQNGRVTTGIDMRLRGHPWFMGGDPFAPWVPAPRH